MDKTNEYVLNRVLDIASQSSVLKSKFKKEVLDEVFDKRRDGKETEEVREELERIQREIDDIEHHIAHATVEMSLNEDYRSIGSKVVLVMRQD